MTHASCPDCGLGARPRRSSGTAPREDYSGSMDLSITRQAVLKELATVGDQLAAPGLTNPERLALLRRQAELGDLRDALADRARRKAIA
jgi:hypothetical protein